MANAKVQEYLKGLQTEKGNLIKAAQDAIKELNEVGQVLGFSYSLTLDDDDQTAKPPKSTGGSTGNRKQMSETDILEAQKAMLAYLKGKKGVKESYTEVFSSMGYPASRHQTLLKHLKALVTGGYVEEELKDKTKKAAPKNPTAYLWVKDLDN